MNRIPLLFFPAGILMISPSLAASEPAPGQQVHVQLESETMAEMGFLLYLPDDYEKHDEWPLIVFLHGIGERGNDLDAVKRHGPPKLIADGQKFPCIVVSPQCPLSHWWEPTVLNALLDDVVDKHKVNPRRVYLTGLSMGGLGTWTFAASYPERFAAIVPICGFADSSCVEPLKNTPVWIFHGDIDDVIDVKHSYRMRDALQVAGNQARLTVYQGVGHNSWTETYENREVLDWLLSHELPATGGVSSSR